MRYALVDNATLTAAQRLLGQVPVKNLYQIDGDISAFEGLVQAVLFYDKVICVDDYKVEFRKERHEFFDFILPLDPADFAYDRLMAAARAATRDIMLRVEAGDIADDDFRRFFDLLRMQTVFTWRMRSSNFFLTVNMLSGAQDLSIEKYSTLAQMIFSELTTKDRAMNDPSAGTTCSLIDSSGHLVNRGYKLGDVTYKVGPQVWAFASSLNWLSLRTAFYSLTAQTSGVEAILHPIRHAFRLHFAHTSLGMSDSVFEPLVRLLRDGVAETVQEIVKTSDPIVSHIKLPIFTAYLAALTKNPQRFLEAAHQLRSKPPIAEARQQLIELEQVVESGDRRSFITQVNRLRRQLDNVSRRLLSEYGVDAPQGVPLSTITSVLNVILRLKPGIELPDFGLRIPLPSALSRISDRRGFKATFRSVVDELVCIERLGALHDVIVSAVVREDGADYFAVQQEDARFRGRDSSVKRWM